MNNLKIRVREPDIKFSSIAHAARYYAQKKPNDIAIKFVSGVSKDDELSFSELDNRALKIASYLIDNTARGERVLLPTNNESAFYSAFLGCMYAGRIGIPIQVPRPKAKLHNMGLDRFTPVIENADVKLILMDESYIKPIEARGGAVSRYFSGATFVSVQSALENSGDVKQIVLPDASELAFLQYTSGSTSAPKGVMLTNECIVENQQSMVECYQLSSESNFVTWLPLYHDMGLCVGFFMPFYLGATSIVFTPLSVMAKPRIWLQEIAKHKNVVSGGPNFIFSHCVARISDADVKGVSLGQWAVAFCGAEPIVPDDIRKFVSKFSPVGFNEESFSPSYGLAEATLFVSAKRATEFPAVNAFDRELIGRNQAQLTQQEVAKNPIQFMSCGRPSFGVDVKIVESDTLRPLPEGHIGEIAVHSKSMGKGYWNNCVETDATFNKSIFGVSGEYFLTGDYGFIKDKELYISGRRKEMIIVNGVNHYPQDIELTARQQYASFANNASTAFTVGEKSQILVLVQEVREKLAFDKINSLQKDIIQAVRAEHQLIVDEVYLVPLGSVPRTSSGKIQRTKCSKLYEIGHFNYDHKTKVAS